MSKKEYYPLLEKGFKEIGLWELDKYFLEPFVENEHRKYLINRFREFLNEFSLLVIDTEIWIDGSFTTNKPEPQDIDMVFIIDRNIVDSLVGKKKELFRQLFFDKEKVKARYSCDIYLVDNGSEKEKEKWIKTFGSEYNDINTKGIYKIILKADV